jgi:hypothetical protein
VVTRLGKQFHNRRRNEVESVMCEVADSCQVNVAAQSPRPQCAGQRVTSGWQARRADATQPERPTRTSR